MSKESATALVIALVVAIAAAALLQCGSEKAPDTALRTITLRLPIPVVDAAFAPYYLAVDRGYFERHGLHVEIEPGTPELNPVKMVSQGIDQFAVLGGPELLLSGRERGAPIIGIAQIHKDSDFVVLLTLKDSGLTRLSQLQGERVGFFYGHISTDIIHMLLRKESVEVQEVDVGFDYSQFIAGNLRAQWAFRTTAGIQLPAKDVEVNVISPAAYGIHTQGHVIITNEEFLDTEPGTVQSFVDAVIEAIEYSLENPSDAVEAARRRDPGFSRQVGEKQLEIYNEAIRRNSRIGWIDLADMRRTHRQMSLVGLRPEQFEVSSSYTTVLVERHFAQAR